MNKICSTDDTKLLIGNVINFAFDLIVIYYQTKLDPILLVKSLKRILVVCSAIKAFDECRERVKFM